MEASKVNFLIHVVLVMHFGLAKVVSFEKVGGTVAIF
jgi:hypothetical protein